ncbi:MAG: hypothetical protein JW705_04690 [Methanosarcinaceae archaeon]|nr:hypothetical protein [Methanosarcinaceae archaeon]
MVQRQKGKLPADIFIDVRGADALPMRFTSAAIILLVLVLLSWTALSSTMEKKSIHDTKAVVSVIDSNAWMMSASGPGSRITLDIDIPEKVSLVLGAIPGHENEWPADAHNYYIMVEGRQLMGESKASYSNEFLNGTAILGPGSHRITLESVREAGSNRIFVRVYEN